jgi:hypothetical protein
VKNHTKVLFGCLLMSFTLFSQASLAACRNFYGKYTAVPDPTCAILSHPGRKREFRDVRFLAETDEKPNSCFKGTFTGTIGQNAVRGTAVSGETLNLLGGSPQNGLALYTSATITSLRTDTGIKLGTLFLRDVGVVELSTQLTNQQFVSIDSSGWLSNARATFNLYGDLSIGALVNGNLCGPFLWLFVPFPSQ